MASPQVLDSNNESKQALEKNQNWVCEIVGISLKPLKVQARHLYHVYKQGWNKNIYRSEAKWTQ